MDEQKVARYMQLKAEREQATGQAAGTDQARLDRYLQLKAEREQAGQAAPVQAPMGLIDAWLEGAKQGTSNLASGVGQLVAPLASRLVTPAELQQAGATRQGLQQALSAPAPVRPNYPAAQQQHPLATAMGEAMPQVAGAVGVGALAGPMGVVPAMLTQGATAGAVGAMYPGSPTERLQRGAVDAGFGALGEGVGRAGMAALGRVLPGQSAEAQRMLQAGIPLTPGQAYGGTARSVEQGLEAVPIVGEAVKRARTKALEAWNREALGRVSPTGKVKEIGSAGLREVNEQFRQSYDGIIGALPERVDFDTADMDTMAGIVREYAPRLTDDSLKVLSGETDRLVQSGIGGLPRDSVMMTRGELAGLAKNAFNDGNVRLGQAFDGLRDALNTGISKHLGPKQSAEFQRVNRLYSEYVPLERAHALVGAATQGHITPSQLVSGLKADDQSLRKAGFARGTRPGQEEAMAAEGVFHRNLPTPGPGSAEKLMTGAGALGLGGMALNDPLSALLTLGGVGGAAAAMPALRSTLVGTSPLARGAGAVAAGAAPGLRALGSQTAADQMGARRATVADQSGQSAAARILQSMPADSVARSQIAKSLASMEEGRDRTLLGGALGDRLPADSVSLLADRPWFSTWVASPVRESANSGRGHALRLGLLSAADKSLSPEQKAALREIQQTLDPEGSYKTRR